MSPSIAPLRTATLVPTVSWFDRQARAGVLHRLRGIGGGAIDIRDADGTHRIGAGEALHVTVHDGRFWRAAALHGSLGVGDAFTDGWWSSDDLVDVLRLIVRNADRLEALEGGMARLLAPIHRLGHLLRDNTRSGSRRNIAAHYDLSNAFYASFLDPTMCYSSAVFASPDEDLAVAQRRKLDRMIAVADIRAGQRVIEIGTGWGAQAIRIAERLRSRVDTTTISREQGAYARAWVEEAGLGDLVTVRGDDYRDLDGTYDRLVSTEMIEAVGRPHYDTYFATIGRLLKPDGCAAIQAITITDQRFAAASREVDFIKARIFPGCCIPSLSAIAHHATRASDLRIVEVHDLTADYALTLRRWRERADAAADRITALGFDAAFQRMWRYYLAYCEAGMAERATSCVQIRLARPQWRPAP